MCLQFKWPADKGCHTLEVVRYVNTIRLAQSVNYLPYLLSPV